jgi:hypothetical protein
MPVRFSDGCDACAFFRAYPAAPFVAARNDLDAADSGIDSILGKE